MYVSKNVEILEVDINLIRPILLKVLDDELADMIVNRIEDVWKDRYLPTVLPNLPYSCSWIFEGEDEQCPTGIIIDEHVNNIRIELTYVGSDKFNVNPKYLPIKVETVSELLYFDSLIDAIEKIVTDHKEVQNE